MIVENITMLGALSVSEVEEVEVEDIVLEEEPELEEAA